MLNHGQAFWAPNAVTWGYDSRAASIRLITPPSCPPSATRMEVRVPGADMNPYFAISAIFLLGLRGIEKKLSIPLPPVKDLMNDKSKVVKLATGLDTATKLFMREGSVAREVFGHEFVEHYGGTREHEVGMWNEAVTNWEGTHLITSVDFWLTKRLVERYLELV
jgi:glutamine synthetase